MSVFTQREFDGRTAWRRPWSRRAVFRRWRGVAPRLPSVSFSALLCSTPTGRKEQRRRRPQPLPGGGQNFPFPSSPRFHRGSSAEGPFRPWMHPRRRFPSRQIQFLHIFLSFPHISFWHRVRAAKKPGMDGEAPLCSPTQVVSVTKVLDDDNLLREIIVRVGLPNTLVRAALVCKRWLEHASDRQFLSRFHELHPPRLLGYYMTVESGKYRGMIAPHFVPMLPQPPELAAVIRLLESYKIGPHEIMQCRNGSIFTKIREGTKWKREVHHPLCAEKGVQIIPPVPHAQGNNRKRSSAIISKEEGSGFSYFYVLKESTVKAGKSMVRVYMLQDGLWRMRASAKCPYGLCSCTKAVVGDNKLYMPAASGDGIIVFDLTASSLYKIQLPQGVKYHYSNTMLSGADDASGIYLVHVKEFQLCIWLHKRGNWLLIDTICLHEMLATLGLSIPTLDNEVYLHEMLATLGISGHTLENEGTANVQIRQVGDSCQFVFLRMGQCIFYLDIKCKTLCKLYQYRTNDHLAVSIHPFMMIWPPTFPHIKDDPARNAM